MNTIPSIFNQRVVARTVFGGSEVCPNVRMDAAVILINGSWSPSRMKTLDMLLDCGFKSVVSVERNPENYNIEDISHRFPSVKFIIPLERVTDGDLVNMAMQEVEGEYALVLRDSIDIFANILTPKLFSKITEEKPFCVCPWLKLQDGVSFPVVFSPSSDGSVFRVDSSTKITDGINNLYPFDGIALFNRSKFIALGGYDYTIVPAYWQNLDLSFRAWLWGEKIVLSSFLTMSYGADRAEEDTTASQYSNRFYLKNLVPKFVRDHAEIPWSSFLLFLPRSSCGFFEALGQFRDARRWVRENQYRFRLDAVSLVEGWGEEEEKANAQSVAAMLRAVENVQAAEERKNDGGIPAEKDKKEK